jgi:hypothetical protein
MEAIAMAAPTDPREIVKREFPLLVREDAEIQESILRLSRQEFAPKRLVDERFDRMFEQMERDREEDKRKWEENQAELRRLGEESERKWEENQAELRRLREESERKWEENQAELRCLGEESERKWESGQAELRGMSEGFRRSQEEQRNEFQTALEEQRNEFRTSLEEHRSEFKASLEEHRREFDSVHREIMDLAHKHDRTVGALGARWGINSEKAFRDALASVLERNFGARVSCVTERDAEGEVFGRPDQIELDIVVSNGTLILMELKSSIDKAGMYIFERKARFYEKRHGRKADRLIVVSPMIDPRAVPVAKRLGIETFGDSMDVRSLTADAPQSGDSSPPAVP